MGVCSSCYQVSSLCCSCVRSFLWLLKCCLFDYMECLCLHVSVTFYLWVGCGFNVVVMRCKGHTIVTFEVFQESKDLTGFPGLERGACCLAAI